MTLHLKSSVLSLCAVLAMTNIGVLLGYPSQYYWFSSILLLGILAIIAIKSRIFLHKTLLTSGSLFALIFTFSMAVNVVYPSFGIGYYFLCLIILPYTSSLIGQYIGYESFYKGLSRLMVAFFALFLCLFLFGGRHFFPHGQFSGSLPTASFFGGMCSVIAMIFFSDFITTRRKKGLIICFISTIFLLLSQHRAGMLALFVGAAFLYLSCNRGLLELLLKRLPFLLIGSLLFVVSISVLFPAVLAKAFYDGNLGITSINFSGRLLVWGPLLVSILGDWSSIFIGHGPYSIQGYFLANHSDIINAIEVPHNEYLRLGYEFGIVGLTTYCLVLFKLFTNNLHDRQLILVSTAAFLHFSTEMMFSNVIYWASAYGLIMFIWIGSLRRDSSAILRGRSWRSGGTS